MVMEPIYGGDPPFLQQGKLYKILASEMTTIGWKARPALIFYGKPRNTENGRVRNWEVQRYAMVMFLGFLKQTSHRWWAEFLLPNGYVGVIELSVYEKDHKQLFSRAGK